MPPLSAVHPLQPRFAQAITGVLALEAAVFDQPVVLVVALALILLSLAGPRWSPVGWVFRRIAPPAGELEPAAPPRFAQAVGLVFGLVGAAGLLLGLDVLFYVAIGMALAAAFLNAAFNFCLGCEMYLLFTRIGVGRKPLTQS